MMKVENSFEIDAVTISKNSPTYFIADIAANHDGDIARAVDLIWLAKKSGADAVKFQHFKANTIVSDVGFKSLGAQKSHQAAWKKSVYEMYKSAELNLEWTEVLKKTCGQAGISFFTSPYDLEIVDAVDKYVPAYKIGSGDITWLEIIRYIAEKGKPVFLATGASTLADVVRAAQEILEINGKLCLMQCNTNYTGSLENMKYVNLSVLKTYSLIFPEVVLGLSDHTPGHATVLGAIALGARAVEKHFTDDIKREGPDHSFSMDPKSWAEMVSRARELEAALGGSNKIIEPNEIETSVLQRRSIRVTREIKCGDVIERGDLEVLRPCPSDALPPSQINKVVGKLSKKLIAKGDYIKLSDLE